MWVKSENELPAVSGVYLIIKDGKQILSYYSAILKQFDACEKKQPETWFKKEGD